MTETQLPEKDSLTVEEKALEYLDEARLIQLENRFANAPTYLQKLVRRLENLFLRHPQLIDDIGVRCATEDKLHITKALQVKDAHTTAFYYGETIIWREILKFLETGDQTDTDIKENGQSIALTSQQREDANVLIAIHMVLTTILWPYEQSWTDVVTGKKAEEKRRYDSAVASITFTDDDKQSS